MVNAGVPGYGNSQELLLLRRLAAVGIVGKIYILNLFTNDITDNLRLNPADLSVNLVQPGAVLDADGHISFEHKPANTLRKGSNLVAGRPHAGPKLLAVVKANLESLGQTRPALAEWARWFGFEASFQRMPGVINGWYNDDVLGKGVPLMKALLWEMNAAVKGLHAHLLVSLIPSPLQVYTGTYNPILRATFPDSPQVRRFLDDPTRPQRIIREMCAELGIPFLDMYDVVTKTAGRSLYIPGDGHFNEAGHAVFATSLAGFVKAHTVADDPS